MTYERHVAPKDMGKYEKELGRTFQSAVKDGLRQAGKQGAAFMGTVSPVFVQPFKGTYNQGWKSDLPAWHTVRVYNPARHAGIMELGRTPNSKRPPVSALVPWVQQKLGVLPARAQSVAFLVARKIGARGMMPRYVLARSLDTLTEGMLKKLDGVLKTWLERSR